MFYIYILFLLIWVSDLLEKRCRKWITYQLWNQSSFTWVGKNTLVSTKRIFLFVTFNAGIQKSNTNITECTWGINYILLDNANQYFNSYCSKYIWTWIYFVAKSSNDLITNIYSCYVICFDFAIDFGWSCWKSIKSFLKHLLVI